MTRIWHGYDIDLVCIINEVSVFLRLSYLFVYDQNLSLIFMFVLHKHIYIYIYMFIFIISFQIYQIHVCCGGRNNGVQCILLQNKGGHCFCSEKRLHHGLQDSSTRPRWSLMGPNSSPGGATSDVWQFTINI